MTTKNNFGNAAKSTLKIKVCGILSAIMTVLCAVAILVSFSACKKQEPKPSQQEPSTAATIDEITYTFAEGICIGSASIGNMTYKEAREVAKTEAEKAIFDFTLNVKADDKTYTYTKADFSFTNNIETLLQEAAEYNNSITNTKSTESKIFDIEFQVDGSTIDSKVEEIANDVDLAPVNSTLKEGRGENVSVTKSKVGYELDRDALANSMAEAISTLSKGEKSKLTVTAKINEIQPSLTYDDLNGKITLLSSFQTYSTNTADGNHNMALALNACNGSVIGPGETWSFNDCTGNSNLTSLGYRPATVIIGGELVPGIGGGLCQSSTTIYNAAIRTNMEIVERYCHYYQSTYADAGLDATIDWPYLDLKLKNPTDYPMYMQCYMSGTTLYCNIYGYQDPSFDEVQIDSYIYDANRKENYYRAAATRTFLKNGKVVLEEQLPGSTYHYVSPSDATKPTETTAPTKPAKPAKPTNPAKPTIPATTVPQATVKPTNPVAPTVPNTSVDPTEPVTTQPVTTPIEY